MKAFDLCGAWRMTGNGYDVEGRIPGSVYSFLHLDNELLPDPYYRDNEEMYTRLCDHDYTFEKVFEYVPSSAPTFLVFEGLDTLCTVYLNGIKLAETDNMHIKYRFSASHALKSGENRLEVVCHSVTKYIKEKNSAQRLFGAYDCMAGYPHVRKAHCMMGWDWGPRLPDAGIWRRVYLLEKDSPEITELSIQQRHDTGKVYLNPQVKTDGDGELDIFITAPDGSVTPLVPNEENEINDPKLWWPNGLGDQPLYEITVSLKKNGMVADEKRLRIGLREMHLIRKADEFGESFYHEINGADLFAMGADYIPEDNILSRITESRTRKLLTHCKECNFNAIRVWGGGYYPDDFFFDICDELGLVVFFDLMFACSVYDPDEDMKNSIYTEVRQNLERIRHHACLGLICGNNEIEWHFHDYVTLSGRSDREHLASVYSEIFETSLPRIVQEVSDELPYIPSSPTSGGGFNDPNGESCGDCHDWESDYMLCREKFLRYVSEFGFQSLPNIKTVQSFTEEKDRNFQSRIMEMHQRSSIGNELILTYLSRSLPYPQSFEHLIYASQILQAESIRYRVEHYRRHRGRCMGALYWQLNDIWPVTSWASIDYYGRYKALQYAAKRFFSPILISCEEIGEAQTRRFINTEKGSFSTEKSARLCVTNDTLNEIGGTVNWELRDAESNVLQKGSTIVTVSPLSAKWLKKLDFGAADPHTDHLYFNFEIEKAVISEGCILFSAPKHYEFKDPRITLIREGDELIVSCAAFAKCVEINGIDGDLVLEDNFFDMEKGERRIKIVDGNANHISVRSLFDIQ